MNKNNVSKKDNVCEGDASQTLESPLKGMNICSYAYLTDREFDTPKLYRASDIATQKSTSSSLGVTLDWVENFLGKPHDELGRKGPVCPFVPTSLALNHIWFAEIKDEAVGFQSICNIITKFREVFLSTEPRNQPAAMNKALLVVFPHITEKGAALVDKVQAKLKDDFVDKGLMLGEFHPTNNSSGLRNPEFRPLRSPIPMLAIRHMVDSDLPFLIKESYPPTLRRLYIKAYLKNLYQSLSPPKFDEALESLVQVEIQLNRP